MRFPSFFVLAFIAVLSLSACASDGDEHSAGHGDRDGMHSDSMDKEKDDHDDDHMDDMDEKDEMTDEGESQDDEASNEDSEESVTEGSTGDDESSEDETQEDVDTTSETSTTSNAVEADETEGSSAPAAESSSDTADTSETQEQDTSDTETSPAEETPTSETETSARAAEEASEETSAAGEPGMLVAYSTTAFNQAQADGKSTALFFHADWCSSCRALEDNLGAQLGSLPQDSVVFIVDWDSNRSLAEELNVRDRTHLVFFDRNGAQKGAPVWNPSVDVIISQLR